MNTRALATALTATATLAITCAPLLAVVPASAATDRVSRVVLTDPRGDVWTGDEGEDPWAVDPAKPTADVVRAVAAHRRYNVVSRMRFADLRRVGDEQSFVAFIETPRRMYGAIVNSGVGHRAGTVQIFDYDTGHVRCRGIRHEIDYGADRVVIQVPRRCIGRPTWVRVSLMNMLIQEFEDERGVRLWSDNPHNTTETAGTTRRLYRMS